ncbi:nuclear transport factor 2 family protein [Mucilaginibacter sp. SP1R1]|uniref:nuclear transport factor 2 family protein n=1 Tax=Mucilaginibacter sp. SP1R1 TaxID=2723091 RepID=UPI00160704F0|nr:nuclear transport factor 2 family protein [Mucilaginibacter sp. SP1R1]MBB6149389.1 ketosteroid isomerase-like protein [Mucilaginibacter sp. SP1R1]
MTAEAEILQLSLDKFRWKTEGDIDRIADPFDDDLVFIHITGHQTTKAEWVRQLRSNSFVYNRIEQRAAAVKIYGDTAILVGKADFTVNGGSVYKLIYTEIYTRKNNRWKLVNLHTTSTY